MSSSKKEKLLRQLRNARSYWSWLRVAEALDEFEQKNVWRRDPTSQLYDSKELRRCISALRSAREEGSLKDLAFQLRRVLSRRESGGIYRQMQNPELFAQAYVGTKDIVTEYQQEVVRCLEMLRDSPAEEPCGGGDGSGGRSPASSVCSSASSVDDGSDGESSCGGGGGGSSVASASAAASSASGFSSVQRIEYFYHATHSLGHTALCLSGGGSLAMYHFGVVKTLLQTGCLPRVVSGASGGAIVAASLACFTDDELMDNIIQPDISNRYGVRWFRPIPSQILTFLRRGVLMDAAEFGHTARTYWGDATFEDAFARTRRMVSITVTVKDRSGDSYSMLLNYLTAPQVYVWSAVTASCALPGLMAPVTLMARDSDGTPRPFFPPGTKMVDGSILGDVPMQRLSELFNVNQFIVCQVNPHVVPFIQAPPSPHTMPHTPAAAAGGADGSPSAGGRGHRRRASYSDSFARLTHSGSGALRRGVAAGLSRLSPRWVPAVPTPSSLWAATGRRRQAAAAATATGGENGVAAASAAVALADLAAVAVADSSGGSSSLASTPDCSGSGSAPFFSGGSSGGSGGSAPAAAVTKPPLPPLSLSSVANPSSSVAEPIPGPPTSRLRSVSASSSASGSSSSSRRPKLRRARGSWRDAFEETQPRSTWLQLLFPRLAQARRRWNAPITPNPAAAAAAAAASASASAASASAPTGYFGAAAGWLEWAEGYLSLGITQRCQMLAKLRLMPRMFGQEMGGVFLQRYVGHITIVPRIAFVDNLGAISHPSDADMHKYLLEGQRAVWPHIAAIKHLTMFESALRSCVSRWPIAKYMGPRAALALARASTCNCQVASVLQRERSGEWEVSEEQSPSAAAVKAGPSPVDLCMEPLEPEEGAAVATAAAGPW